MMKPLSAYKCSMSDERLLLRLNTILGWLSVDSHAYRVNAQLEVNSLIADVKASAELDREAGGSAFPGSADECVETLVLKDIGIELQIVRNSDAKFEPLSAKITDPVKDELIDIAKEHLAYLLRRVENGAYGSVIEGEITDVRAVLAKCKTAN